MNQKLRNTFLNAQEMSIQQICTYHYSFINKCNEHERTFVLLQQKKYTIYPLFQ
jgi:hypothetical protein